MLGVVHTNYISYAKLYQPENIGIVKFINAVVARAYCDGVIKLSDSLQSFPRSAVCNVHGVRSEFIEAGRAAATAGHHFGEGAYFIGKVLWAKGYRQLIDYLSSDEGTRHTRVDVYGDGEDLKQIEGAAMEAALQLSFLGSRDHADPKIRPYKVMNTCAEIYAEIYAEIRPR